jgi:hypothetical protein
VVFSKKNANIFWHSRPTWTATRPEAQNAEYCPTTTSSAAHSLCSHPGAPPPVVGRVGFPSESAQCRNAPAEGCTNLP